MYIYIVTWLLKAGKCLQEEAHIVRQRRGKYFFVAMNQQSTIEELLEAMFSVRSVLRLRSEDQREPTAADQPTDRGVI
jgi:ribosome-interacting GTPase 1